MYFGPERKNMRMKNYDYSQDGYYFITINVKNRESHFGEIVNGVMILNEYGKIVENEILITEKIRTEIKIDEFVVMSDHVHMIVVINPSKERLHRSQPHRSDNGINQSCFSCTTQSGTMQSFLTGNNLSSVVRGLKCSVTRQINDIQKDFIFLWQKSFHDTIIKDDQELNNMRRYIRENPSRGMKDFN